MRICSVNFLVALTLLACNPKPETQKVLVRANLGAQAEYSQQFLNAPARRAIQHGAGPLEHLAHGVGLAGDEISSLVAIAPGQCGLFISRGSPDVKDLDLLAFTDDGSLIGADEARDDVPTLLLCPSTGERIFISARIAKGKGLIALGVQAVALKDALTIAEALGAKGLAPQKSEDLEQWPGLTASVTRHQQELGFAVKHVQSMALPVDSRLPTRISASVKSHQCLSVQALPDSDIAYLDLELEDQYGHIIARARQRDSERWLLACAGAEPEVVNISLRPHLGRGLVALVISESVLQVAEIQALTALNPTYIGQMMQRAKSNADNSLDLKVGELRLKTLTLAGCTRIELKPSWPLLDYRVKFWSQSGKLLGRYQGRFNGFATVCAQGSVYMEGEARLRGGPLDHQLTKLRNSENDDKELVILHPLATGEMFNLLQTFEPKAALPALSEIAIEPISAHQRIRKTITLAEGQCIRQFAVLSAGPNSLSSPIGLRLLALDARTGELLSSDQHNHRATLSVCSKEKERDLILELTLNEGAGQLLHYAAQRPLPEE